MPKTGRTTGIDTHGAGTALALVILALALLAALLPKAFPDFETWQAKLPVRLTELMSPGTVSPGHRQFGGNCSACHERAFRAVADAACTRCHEGMKPHLAADAPQRGALSRVACADCHAGHAGKANALRRDSGVCVECHGKAGGDLARVRDFGERHPEFRLNLPRGEGRAIHVSLETGALPTENASLKFSHQVHLDPKGLATPEGQTVMTCRDCHRDETTAGRFKPIDMATCQQSRCHRSYFGEPARGLVPHGSERAVIERLRGAYATWISEEPGIARQCASAGRPGNALQAALACADELSHRHAAATLFKEDGEGCPVCHAISRDPGKDAAWKVAPVRTNHDWQPNAVFPHSKHDAIRCTDCHDKSGSAASADVSFPRIGKCRECHAGSAASAGRLPSTCAGCHPFHRQAGKRP